MLRPTIALDKKTTPNRGQAAGAPIDLYGSGVTPTEGIELGDFSLSAGENTLTAEIVGQNPGNPFPDRFYLGLDALSLVSTDSPVSPTLTVEPTQLSWTPVPLTIGYDVLRGNLQALRDSGDFGQAVDACLADDQDANSLPYAVDPLPGEAFFFLVGDACTGTFDSEGGQQGSRDPGIDASPPLCSDFRSIMGDACSPGSASSGERTSTRNAARINSPVPKIAFRSRGEMRSAAMAPRTTIGTAPRSSQRAVA